MSNFLKVICLFVVVISISVTTSQAAETWGYKSTSSNCTLNDESWIVSLSTPTKYATGDNTPILVAVTNNSGLSKYLNGGTIKIKELDIFSDDLVLEKNIGSIYFENGTTYYFRLAGDFNPFTELGVAKVFAEIDSQVDFGPTTSCLTPAKSLSSGLILNSIEVTGPDSLNQNQTGQFYSELVFNDGTRLLDHTPISSSADADSINRMVAWGTAAPGSMQPTGSFKAGSVAATTNYDVLAVSTYNNGYITGKKSFDIVKPIYTLYTYANIAGWGSVTKGGDYPTGQSVTIQAYPAAGYEFKEWSGASSSTANPTTVTITDNVGVTANFIPITYNYKLTVSANPTIGGSVTGGGTYSSNTTVNVKATPATGYTFTGWSGGASGTENPIGIDMTGDKTVTANFSQSQAPQTDTIPNAFSFTEQTGVARNTLNTSNSITVSGIDTATTISVSGGGYSIDGGGFTTVSQTVTNGQSVRVRVTSSASYFTQTSATLTIGGVGDTFSVTTEASTSSGDTTPDAFYFTDQPNVGLNSLVTSNAITVSGTNAEAPISVSGGSYSINSGSFTSNSGTVTNGQSVRVAVTSSSNYSAVASVQLTIGGVSGAFGVTTRPPGAVGIPGALTVPSANGDGSYTISWGASSTYGVSYVLEEATNSSFTSGLSTPYSGTGRSTTIYGKDNGRYYYRVKAISSGYTGSPWSTASTSCLVTLVLTKVAPPTNLSVPSSNTNGSFSIGWSPSSTPGVTYIIEESSTSASSGFIQIHSFSGMIGDNIYVQSSGTYYYRVKATKAGYPDSDYVTASNGCTVTFPIVSLPSSLTVPVVNDPDGSYTVSWGMSSTPDVTYVLEEATNSSFTTGLRTAYSGNSQSARISGRGNGSYYYRIKATKQFYAGSGYRIGSNGCTVTMLVLSSPTNLVVPSADPDGSYTVTWSSISTAGVRYILEEWTNSTYTTGWRGFNTSGTSIDFNGNADGTYYYRVKAVKSGYVDSGFLVGGHGCTVTLPVAGLPSSFTVPNEDQDGRYTATWGSSSTAGVTYILEESATSSIADFKQIYSGVLTSKEITGRSPGTYYYRVKATKSGYADSGYQSVVVSILLQTVGFPKWSVLPSSVGWWLTSSPSVAADGTIYISSPDKRLYAFSADGSLKWAFTTAGALTKPAMIGADGTIYVGSDDRNLYAINPDGSPKWTFPITNQNFKNAGIGADGTIYIATYDGKLSAVNPDGSEKWVFQAGGSLETSSAIGVDGTIYIGSYDHNLYAINPDGSQKWVFLTGGSLSSSPAIDTDGTIYIGSSDKNLYAINPEGSQKWMFPTAWGVSSSPAIGVNGTIYVGTDSNPGYLYAINPDGSQRWAFRAGNSVSSSPAIGADGTIYVGSDDNNLYAINTDGSKKWSFLTGDDVYTPVIGTDGTVYVTGGDLLYAIYDDSGGLADTPWPMYGQNLSHTSRRLLTVDFPASISVLVSDNDGEYVIGWGASSTQSVTYILQEATNSSFTSDLRTAYTGDGLSATISGKGNGTYYYRVKATRSGYTDSINLVGSNGCAVILPLAKTGLPSSVTVPSNDSIGSYTVSWGPSSTSGVTYVLEEATNSNFTSGLRSIFTGTGLTTTVSGKASGSYFYRVKATRGGYEDSVYQTANNGCVVSIPLPDAATPASISVPINSVNGDFIISWGVSSTPGVTYVLEEATNSSFTSGLRTAYNGSGLNATISGKVDGTYYYRVKATAAGYTDSEYLKSFFGCQVVIPLAAPPASISVPISDDNGEYTIAWGVSGTPSVNYVLEEATDSNFTSDFRVAYSGTGLNATISGKTNRSYYYRVKATRSGYGESAYSTANNGCVVSISLDLDNDGVADEIDTCPGTLAQTPVDANGCQLVADSDNDGVSDTNDTCPSTPAGTLVDAAGCPLASGDVDTDGDGVADGLDAFPNDPAASIDTDGDGLPDEWNPGQTEADSTTGLQIDPLPNDSAITQPGIVRDDGGSASSNIFAGFPRVEAEYTFQASIEHDSSIASVWLLLNGYPMAMDCGVNPDFSIPGGVACSAATKLGPSFSHSYQIIGLGTPDYDPLATPLIKSGPIPGPAIELLNGPNMVGLAKDLASSSLGLADSVGSNSVYEWLSNGVTTDTNNGTFAALDNTALSMPGKGYFVIRDLNATLPDLRSYPETDSPTVAVDLSPGWNIISNPYGGQIKLSDVEVQRDTDLPVTWTEACTNRWLTNSIYTFLGSDWGSAYSFESAGGDPEATLTPWVGYWVYMIRNDANYKLIFTKP